MGCATTAMRSPRSCAPPTPTWCACRRRPSTSGGAPSAPPWPASGACCTSPVVAARGARRCSRTCASTWTSLGKRRCRGSTAGPIAASRARSSAAAAPGWRSRASTCHSSRPAVTSTPSAPGRCSLPTAPPIGWRPATSTNRRGDRAGRRSGSAGSPTSPRSAGRRSPRRGRPSASTASWPRRGSRSSSTTCSTATPSRGPATTARCSPSSACPRNLTRPRPLAEVRTAIH